MRTVYILGNGPSVRIQDLDSLCGKVVFSVNRFHLCYSQTALRPKLTFVEDPFMADNHLRQIATEAGSPVLVPAPYAHGLNNSNIVKYRLKPNDEEMSFFSSSLIDGNYFGASVIYGALQTAFWVGARRIILYGIDHDFEIPTSGSAGSDGLVMDSGEQNHFIPGYRRPGERWAPPETEKIEKAFRTAEAYSRKKGVLIFNATRGGRLEIFERKSFDELARKRP